MPALQGGRNFRDLGGYTTTDGRTVRWGRLYRSGVMSYFTDVDIAAIDQLGIRVICDLRTSHERRREPTRWGATAVEQLNWEYDSREVSLRTYLADATEFSTDVARRSMIRLYRHIPTIFAAHYAGLFRRLADGDVPLVFHCSAGKDRTGVAAALVLMALGVSREQVVEDYALTDRVVDLEKALFEHPRGSIGLGEDRSYLSRFDRATRAPLLQALPEYLAAAFDEIESTHGSIDTYLEARLAVTPGMLETLRGHLLEG
jgi:protein-tyrosine phosphatase